MRPNTPPVLLMSIEEPVEGSYQLFLMALTTVTKALWRVRAADQSPRVYFIIDVVWG